MSILFGGETSQTNHEPFFVGPPTSLHALRIGEIKREGKRQLQWGPTAKWSCRQILDCVRKVI